MKASVFYVTADAVGVDRSRNARVDLAKFFSRKAAEQYSEKLGVHWRKRAVEERLELVADQHEEHRSLFANGATRR